MLTISIKRNNLFKGEEKDVRNRVFVSSSPQSSVWVLPFIIEVKWVDVIFDALRRYDSFAKRKCLVVITPAQGKELGRGKNQILCRYPEAPVWVAGGRGEVLVKKNGYLTSKKWTSIDYLICCRTYIFRTSTEQHRITIK